MKERRLVSSQEIYSIMRNAKDFYKRSHILSPIKIVYWLSIILVGAFFSIQCFSGLISADITKYKLDNLITSTIIINLFFIALVITATYLIYRMQRIVLISEFQNLLFSSAMREKSLFYAIFSQKNVIYTDENFKKFLQVQNNIATTAELLEKMQIDSEQKEQIASKINNKESFTAECEYKGKRVTLDLAPLARPQGFFSLKGFCNQ